METIVKKFDELTVHELYEILKIRSAVFVVEQNCAYQDLDGVDKNTEGKPNVLVILMDDMGYGDTSLNGAIYDKKCYTI